MPLPAIPGSLKGALCHCDPLGDHVLNQPVANVPLPQVKFCPPARAAGSLEPGSAEALVATAPSAGAQCLPGSSGSPRSPGLAPAPARAPPGLPPFCGNESVSKGVRHPGAPTFSPDWVDQQNGRAVRRSDWDPCGVPPRGADGGGLAFCRVGSYRALKARAGRLCVYSPAWGLISSVMRSASSSEAAADVAPPGRRVEPCPGLSDKGRSTVSTFLWAAKDRHGDVFTLPLLSSYFSGACRGARASAAPQQVRKACDRLLGEPWSASSAHRALTSDSLQRAASNRLPEAVSSPSALAVSRATPQRARALPASKVSYRALQDGHMRRPPAKLLPVSSASAFMLPDIHPARYRRQPDPTSASLRHKRGSRFPSCCTKP